MTRTDPGPRLWAKVDKTGDCWVWGGALSNGYGEINVGGKPRDTHRLAWELTYGPIPTGMVVMHVCDNKPCVRPDHLRVGTQGDNLRDMFAKGRNRSTGRTNHPRATHCKNGHPYTDESTHVYVVRREGRPDSIARHCRDCWRMRAAARKATA